MTTIADLLADNPFYVAHRGGSGRWPEMTLCAYRNSVAAGYRALELSLARTRDGVWFGLHDFTLDRTSGTHGADPSTMTWEQVRAYRVKDEPYAKLDDVLSEYAATHVILVDPKGKAADHRRELFDVLKSLPHWDQHIVIKSSADRADSVGRDAREAGFTTWGFYYHDKQTMDSIESTHHVWSWLGLNHSAPQEAWDRITRFGKPVIGHIVENVQQRDSAVSKGARGIMSMIPGFVGP